MKLDISLLPMLNALLNVLVTVLLLRGRWLIGQGRREDHRRAMLGACIGSVIFLASYVTYHLAVGSVRFPGSGAARTIYLTILVSHALLAAVLPILVPVTLFRALRSRFDRHRRIARVALPIWLYVSVTGVIVYLMLYQIDWS